MTKTFLKAEWRKLAMANYAIDSNILKKYLPPNTEIDHWNNKCYVSLVGFMFMNTKLKGISIPFHSNFEEVNLRFYVRYNENGNWKRGVVFIKEIVPNPALTFVANLIYKENYETMPMHHTWDIKDNLLTVEYKWKKKNWNSIKVQANNYALDIKKESKEEFITEHFWGYTKLNDTKTSEYGVEHPRWKIYEVKNYEINVDFEDTYGNDFKFLKFEKPESFYLAEGSEIEVKHGRKI